MQNDNRINHLKNTLKKLNYSLERISSNTFVYQDVKEAINKCEAELKELESLKKIN